MLGWSAAGKPATSLPAAWARGSGLLLTPAGSDRSHGRKETISRSGRGKHRVVHD